MDEAAARAHLKQVHGVSRETEERLEEFICYLADENERQNLVSRGTMSTIWSRHILDSAQLLRFAPTSQCSWLDLGSGAGFPGLIVALLHAGRVTLIEERRKRAEFLTAAAHILGVEGKLTIHAAKVERVETRPFEVISARAFAPLGRLLDLAYGFSTANTRFVLPKGRNASSELEAMRSSWQGEFRLEKSVTDGEAHIIVAEQVRRSHADRKGRA